MNEELTEFEKQYKEEHPEIVSSTDVIKEKKKRGRKTGYKRSEKEIKKMVETRARNKLAYGGYTKLEDEVNNDL